MLPLPNAIGCAQALSKKFEKSFREKVPEIDKAMISAGLVFSHYRVPLKTVMLEAHHILDDVAKDQNGRGSIAISVLKPSGKFCQWASTWEGLNADGDKTQIDDLVSRIQGGENHDTQFSSSFFYNMRDTFTTLSGNPTWEPGSYGKLVEGIDPVRLLTAEYVKSREQKVNRKCAEERVRALLRISYKNKRLENGVHCVDDKCLCSDGALLVKFLSLSMEGEKE
jgi:CRISPR-associated protein Cmr2